MADMNPVGWFEIYVQDLPRAQKFYEDVFGFSFTPMANPTDDDLEMTLFTEPGEDTMGRPGATGALCRMAGFPSGGNSTLVYFMSEDCSVQEGRVAAAGGGVFKSKFPIGEYGFISLCTDTEGNMLGIHSMK